MLKMLRSPKNGWIEVIVNHDNLILCKASYLTDVATDLIKAFLKYFNTGEFHVEFECETYQAALTLFNDDLYFIFNEGFEAGFIGGLELTNNICGLPDSIKLNEKMCFLAKELIDDIKENLTDWIWWDAVTVTEAVKNEHELLDKLAELYIYT